MKAGIYRCLGVLFSLAFLYIPFYVNVSELKARVFGLVSFNEISRNVARESTISHKGHYENSLIHHNCENDSTQLRDSEEELWRVFRNVSAGFTGPTGVSNITNEDIYRIKITIALIASHSSNFKLRNYGLHRKHCAALLGDNGTVLTRPMRVKLVGTGFSLIRWINPGGLECKNRDSHCIFYHQHKTMNLSDYDVVLTHLRGFSSASSFVSAYPAERLPTQPWILMNTESPANSFSNAAGFSELSRYFNFTVMFGTKSDIGNEYGECRHITSVLREWPTTAFSREAMPEAMKFWVDFPNFAASKQTLIAWVVSNCNTQSQRKLYVDQLTKFVPVDIIGRCGPNKNNPLSQCATKHFCPEVYNKYKFYLAFENSLCEDYVSEKVFKVLVPEMYAVPILMGLADYETILPKNSYIDVRNFTSAEHLASYLKYLDKNDEAYNSYFNWRKEYICRERLISDACALCEALHGLPLQSVHTQPDLNAVFGSQNCISPAKFFNKTA